MSTGDLPSNDEEDFAELLDSIPAPVQSPNDTPKDADPATRSWPSDDVKGSDVVTLILIGIIALGIILLIIAHALTLAVDVDIPSKSTASVSEVYDLMVGLGADLAGSAGCLLLFFKFLKIHRGEKRPKAKPNEWTTFYWVICGLFQGLPIWGFVCVTFVVGTLLILGSLILPVDASIMASLGVEICGASLVFTILDNVIETLERGRDSEDS